MSRSVKAIRVAVFAAATAAAGYAAAYPGVGREAAPAEIKAWDIDVRPDFKGLPPGSGSVSKGEGLWESRCASCHGTFGESNEVFTPIVGGTTAEDMKTGHVKALTRPDVTRTTLMKVSTISTLWDYIHRAMPWNAPKSLSNDDVYAVLAYILNLGDIVPSDFALSDKNIAEVQARLPNRDGMTTGHGLWSVKGKPDVKNVACMKNCEGAVHVVSSLPKAARGAWGNLAEQNRLVGPVRGVQIAGVESNPPTSAAAKSEPAAAADAPIRVASADLAKRSGCMNCHGVDEPRVGPAFREVAQRYQKQPTAIEALVQKVRAGGSGTWGQIPMPPNPQVGEGQVEALVQWILAGAR